MSIFNVVRVTVAALVFILFLVMSATTTTAQAYLQNLDWLQNVDESLAERLKNDADNGQSEAQYALGILYYKGVHFDRDFKQAAYWFLVSAKGGHVKAMQNIGVMYIRGEGVKRDFIEGVKWFDRAADAGDTFAMHSLGLRYENGDGVLQDYRRALSYYKRASDLGFAGAQYSIGMLYAQGKGVPRDLKEAVYWTEKAADGGYPAALYNLGVAHATGQGVQRDLVEAHKYFNLCVALAERNHQDDVIEKRNLVAKSLSERQIAIAQERAKKWLAERPTIKRQD